MRTVLPILLGALLALSAAGVAEADTITLKSGGVIEGKIISEDDTEVVVDIGKMGKMVLARRDIEKIEKDDNTGEIHKRPGTIKGRKKPPPDDGEKEESGPTPKPGDSGKPEPGDAAQPRKDNPYVDREEVSIEDAQLALSQINRLGQKSKFRNRARNKLRALGNKAGRALAFGLTNPVSNVRKECAMLIAEIGYKPAVPMLIKSTIRDEDVHVREAGGQALRKLAGKSMGFNAAALPRHREDAAKKWDKWWNGQVKIYGNPEAAGH